MTRPSLRFVYDEAGFKRNEVFAARLMKAARKAGIAPELCVLPTRSPIPRLTPVDIAMIRSRVPELRSAATGSAGLAVNNPKIALLGNDKLALARFLSRHQIPHPLTWMASALGPCREQLIQKPRFGHGGLGVGKVSNPRCGLDSFILQEPVLGADQDVRVYVVGDHPLACVARSATSGFRSNLRFGATARATTLESEQKALVIRLISLLGPGYYGIDLVGPPAKPMVMEIEDLVGARALYMLGIVDPAMAVASWMASLL